MNNHIETYKNCDIKIRKLQQRTDSKLWSCQISVMFHSKNIEKNTPYSFNAKTQEDAIKQAVIKGQAIVDLHIL